MNESAERAVLLTRMFDSYGQVPTPSRLDTYADVLGNMPLGALAEGIRDAMREVGDYPPGPGTIRRHALAVAKMRPGDPVELPAPVDNFPRLGPGTAPVGALFSGLERRVERSYQRVMARAREIASERSLPWTLDVRLWALGEAEADLNFVESSPCRCATPCSKGELERSLTEQRRLAGLRCGAIAIARDAA